MKIDSTLLDQTIDIARRAGDAILDVYQRDGGFSAELKGDNSPVTEADLAAHEIMFPALQAIDPDVPVLSEESALPDYATRSGWDRYWIIDPLDGTKEFIKRNGEFTVNIALIENGVPVLGVVHVPVLQITYAGGKEIQAVKIDASGQQPIRTRAVQDRIEARQTIEVVASRSHGAEAVTALIDRIEAQLGTVATKNMGSSLKLCLVAEGAADIYPRLALTSEWDTAAAQAVVEAAGGIVLDIDLNVLRYNQKEEILNPFFYVIGDPEFDWKALLAAG